ncbi:DUF952 domain-containing protein [Sphingomonas jatrophae]|uniref:Beta-hydroxylase n=1 Tax=Sphingomonas jatrophae TaxID=1166337 RepID=A0A1I6JJI9_9SPHN|nr:DUF952 domain-containing protein [Sphingomonas jatrophae]SFR79071.1 beta-hydroxylase [Sphingomonas jatrophae]
MKSPLYKVMTADEWAAFDRDGQFAGSELDRRDGYIHLCAGDQVAGVVQRWFDGRTGLHVVALTIPEDKRLKWEMAQDRACYPHFYAALDRNWVQDERPLPDDPDQRALTLALMAV